MVSDENLKKKVEELLKNFGDKEGIYQLIENAPEKFIDKEKKYYSAYLDLLAKEYESKKISNLLLSAELINYTANYLEKISLAQKDIDGAVNALKFRDLCNKILIPVFGKRLEEANNKYLTGIFTIGLVLYGSSANEAFLSMAEWTSSSKNTIESCYRNSPEKQFWLSEIKLHDNTELTQTSFLLNFKTELIQVIELYKKNSFPERNKKSDKYKTYQAFRLMTEQLFLLEDEL